jgi:signal transduction histidine kinase
MGLLRAIEWLQQRKLAALALGLALEALAMSVIGTDDSLRGVRGIGGETGALLAVVGAIFAGPWVGVAMAALAWSIFFPLVAQSKPASVIALGEWVLAAYLAGRLSSALVDAHRERALAEQEREAAHALRAPVATIHGLVEALGARAARDEDETKILSSIADETNRLLRSPLFDSPR